MTADTSQGDGVARYPVPTLCLDPVRSVPAILVASLSAYLAGRAWQVALSALFEDAGPARIPSPLADGEAFEASLRALADRTGMDRDLLADGTSLAMLFLAFNAGRELDMDLSFLCPCEAAIPRLQAWLAPGPGGGTDVFVPDRAAPLACLLSFSRPAARAYAAALIAIGKAAGDGLAPVRVTGLRRCLDGAWPADTPESLLVPAAISAGARCAMTTDGEPVIFLDSRYRTEGPGQADGAALSGGNIALAIPSLEDLAGGGAGWIAPDRLSEARDCMVRGLGRRSRQVPGLLDIRLVPEADLSFDAGILAEDPGTASIARQIAPDSDSIELGKLRFRPVHTELAEFCGRVARALSRLDHPLQPFPEIVAGHLDTVFALPAAASAPDVVAGVESFIPAGAHRHRELVALLEALSRRRAALWQCDLLIEGPPGMDEILFACDRPDPEGDEDRKTLSALRRRTGSVGVPLEELYVDLRRLGLVPPPALWQRTVGAGRRIPGLLLSDTLLQRENVPLRRHIAHMDESGAHRIAWFESRPCRTDGRERPSVSDRSHPDESDGRPALLWTIVIMTMDPVPAPVSPG